MREAASNRIDSPRYRFPLAHGVSTRLPPVGVSVTLPENALQRVRRDLFARRFTRWSGRQPLRRFHRASEKWWRFMPTDLTHPSAQPEYGCFQGCFLRLVWRGAGNAALLLTAVWIYTRDGWSIAQTSFSASLCDC